jgi:hypothetical protein
LQLTLIFSKGERLCCRSHGLEETLKTKVSM